MLRLIAVCLLASTFAASAAETAAPAMTTKVTPLTAKDLEGLPGKEGSLVLVEYPPGGSDPVRRQQRIGVRLRPGRKRCDASARRQGSDAEQGRSFLENRPRTFMSSGETQARRSRPSFLPSSSRNKGAPAVFPAK